MVLACCGRAIKLNSYSPNQTIKALEWPNRIRKKYIQPSDVFIIRFQLGPVPKVRHNFTVRMNYKNVSPSIGVGKQRTYKTRTVTRKKNKNIPTKTKATVRPAEI